MSLTLWSLLTENGYGNFIGMNAKPGTFCGTGRNRKKVHDCKRLSVKREKSTLHYRKLMGNTIKKNKINAEYIFRCTSHKSATTLKKAYEVKI